MMYDQARAQQPGDQPRGGVSGHRAPGPEPVFPADEREKILRRLGRALNTFPDTPLDSLEECEAAFDEATDQLMAVLAEQRRILRAGWEGQDPETHAAELHLAVRRYREITQRVLGL